MSIAGYEYLASKATYDPLMDVLISLPNLQVLSGIHLPSEEFITAINNSSLPSVNVGGYVRRMSRVPVECIRSKPGMLRKLRIPGYYLDDAESIEWLSAASPVYVDYLDFSNLQIGTEFLDHPPTALSLNSIKVQIHPNDTSEEAAEFTEKLRRYIHGPGRGIKCVCFDASDAPRGFEPIKSMPLIGSVLDVFSSIAELYKYVISRTTLQSDSDGGWDAWKIISLQVVSCPSNQNYLKAVSEEAVFLETLNVEYIDSNRGRQS
jgi:hypothetical protein